MKKLIPSWARAWYVFNSILLPYDFLFIILRPRSYSADGLARVFSPLHLYAKYDKIFGDAEDAVIYYIYIIGFMDILLALYLAVVLSRKASACQSGYISALVLVQSAEVATKSLIYLMYSWSALVRPYRIAITLMNGTWVLVPVALILSVSERLRRRLDTEDWKSN